MKIIGKKLGGLTENPYIFSVFMTQCKKKHVEPK